MSLALVFTACDNDNEEANEMTTDTSEDAPIDEGGSITDSTTILNDSVIVPKSDVDSNSNISKE